MGKSHEPAEGQDDDSTTAVMTKRVPGSILTHEVSHDRHNFNHCIFKNTNLAGPAHLTGPVFISSPEFQHSL